MDKEPLTIQPTNEVDNTSSERLSIYDMTDQIGKLALDSLGIQAVYDGEKTPEEAEAATSMANLRDYFRIDGKIKYTLASSAPIYVDNPYYYDGTGYEEILYKSLKVLDWQFNDLAEKFGQLAGDPGQIIEKKNLLIKKTKEDIAIAGFDFNNLAKICNEDIVGMDEGLMREISTEMSGYYLWKNPGKMIDKVNTLSELLHLVHMDIQSNEEFYSKLPKWGEVRDDGIKYDAYGEKTKHYSDIFDAVASALSVERVDELGNNVAPAELMQLYSCDNITQLLVRDYGHALSIEVDTSKPQSAMIRYNIPKVINIEIVNKLPGVRPVRQSDNRVGTGGRFEVPYDNLGKEVADFILRVPTDAMIKLDRYSN